MSPLAIALLGFAMSTDAFAAAIGKGASMHKPRLSDALRAGAIFGTIEGLTPAIGWALGMAAAAYVTQLDHWIAFALLGVLGVRMMIGGLRKDDAHTAETRDSRHGFWDLAATGFATSIDAMAVGVGLALLDVNIVVVATVIGLCTMVMVTIGIMLGRVLGSVVGKRAEVLGGLILVGIGCAILYDHLSGTGGTLGLA